MLFHRIGPACFDMQTNVTTSHELPFLQHEFVLETASRSLAIAPFLNHGDVCCLISAARDCAFKIAHARVAKAVRALFGSSRKLWQSYQSIDDKRAHFRTYILGATVRRLQKVGRAARLLQ